ncbi:hypothetical protein, partial [Streptomyces gobitricini]|uniref:hypothetical protein n=1 Tax=Streptomyces gobitricini TaxID=68211 RepID=UPI0031DADDF0
MSCPVPYGALRWPGRAARPPLKASACCLPCSGAADVAVGPAAVEAAAVRRAADGRCDGIIDSTMAGGPDDPDG